MSKFESRTLPETQKEKGTLSTALCSVLFRSKSLPLVDESESGAKLLLINAIMLLGTEGPKFGCD